MDSDLGGPGMDQLPAPLLPQQLTASQHQQLSNAASPQHEAQLDGTQLKGSVPRKFFPPIFFSRTELSLLVGAMG